MDILLFYIGIVGNIISVLVFASPIKTFWRIVKNKSTEDFNSSPYVLTLLSSCVWVYYGISKPDGLLVATVNSVGVALEAIYVSLFLIFATRRLRIKTACLAAVLNIGFFGVVVLASQIAIHDQNLRLRVIGAICVCLSMFMYGSPLAATKTVISTKSVEFMPFFLSFFLFLNGGVWAIYAVLDRDVFLGIPNGVGFFLGTIQLIVYMIYMNTKESKQSREGIQDEWQHQCLIVPTVIQENDEEEGHPIN